MYQLTFKWLSEKNFRRLSCVFDIMKTKVMKTTLLNKLLPCNNSTYYNIVWFSIKVTTLNSNFLMVYSSENILFLYLHFTWLYGLWNHQRILKNIHFENMIAGFLQRCQNPVRWNTPEIIHFQAWQKLIFTNIAP